MRGCVVVLSYGKYREGWIRVGNVKCNLVVI